MKENAYFDNAATTWPKPEPVYTFMDQFFRSHGVNPGRSGSLLAAEAEQMISDTRSMLAAFFGFSGASGRVVFTLNGTDALNMGISGLIGAGDHIVTTRLEHNAVLRLANHYERDNQLQVSKVAPRADGYIEPSDIRSAINSTTRAIVLNHASNVIGTVQPLADVAQIAREAGIPLIVDTAQTAGVLPIAMDDLGISVLTFPGHKGLFGPMGIGGMVVSEDIDLAPRRFGGTGVDSLSTYQPDAYPFKLEAGTVSLPGIAGLHAAQHWFRSLGELLSIQSDSRDPADPMSVEPGDETARMAIVHKAEETTHEALKEPANPLGKKALERHAQHCQLATHYIHETELRHIERIEAKLREHKAVRILAKARSDARVATLSFTVEGMSIEQIADQLDADHQICARAGLQCAPLVHVDARTVDEGGTIRLSPGFFTDEEDMQQLLQALDEVLG